LNKRDKENLEKQKVITKEKIKNITNGAFVLCYESFKGGYLVLEDIKSLRRGITNHLRIFSIEDRFKKINIKDISIKDIIKNVERYKFTLNNYEKILFEIQNSEEMKENSIKEAICIANILKLNQILGEFNSKRRTLLRYAERCKYIIDINKDREQFKTKNWYIEFSNLYKILKQSEPKYDEYHKILPEIKNKYSEIFNEIERQFNKKKSNYDFIKFILDKHPYKNYEKDNNNSILKTYSLELVHFLLDKYHPDYYSFTGEYKIKLQYCIIHEIFKKLNNIYITAE